jgi:hypothetical protein
LLVHYKTRLHHLTGIVKQNNPDRRRGAGFLSSFASIGTCSKQVLMKTHAMWQQSSKTVAAMPWADSSILHGIHNFHTFL